MGKTLKKSTSVHWALTGVFAALHLVISLIPYSIVLGTTGIISLGIISGPLIGFILGPIYGPISVLMGSYLAIMLDPAIAVIGPFTPLATGAGALAAGGLRTRRVLPVLAVYLASLVAFLVGPLGGIAYPFLLPHIVSLSIIILLLHPNLTSRMPWETGNNTNGLSKGLKIYPLSFVAVMVDNAVGNSLAAMYFIHIIGADVTAMTGIFLGVLFLYPVERLIAALIVASLYVVVRAAMIQTNTDFLSSTPEDEEPKPSGIDPENE